MVYLRIRSRAAGSWEKQRCLPKDRALTAIAEILNRVFQEINKQPSTLHLLVPLLRPTLAVLLSSQGCEGSCEGVLFSASVGAG